MTGPLRPSPPASANGQYLCCFTCPAGSHVWPLRGHDYSSVTDLCRACCDRAMHTGLVKVLPCSEMGTSMAAPVLYGKTTTCSWSRPGGEAVTLQPVLEVTPFQSLSVMQPAEYVKVRFGTECHDVALLLPVLASVPFCPLCSATIPRMLCKSSQNTYIIIQSASNKKPHG